jgi:hypothetical protein
METMETIAEKPKLKILQPLNPAPEISAPKGWKIGLSWQAQQFERARFGWMAILITLQSCVGAVACLFVSKDPSDIISLAIGAAVTMGSNALFIALAPPKVCIAGFYISMIANITMILIGLV